MKMHLTLIWGASNSQHKTNTDNICTVLLNGFSLVLITLASNAQTDLFIQHLMVELLKKTTTKSTE